MPTVFSQTGHLRAIFQQAKQLTPSQFNGMSAHRVKAVATDREGHNLITSGLGTLTGEGGINEMAEDLVDELTEMCEDYNARTEESVRTYILARVRKLQAEAAKLGVTRWAAIFANVEEHSNAYLGKAANDCDTELARLRPLAVAATRPGAPRPPATPALTPLGGQYVPERDDPKHRLGHLLASCRSYFDSRPELRTNYEFLDWLDGLSYFEVFQVLKATNGSKAARNDTGAFMKGVTYISEQARPDYACEIEGNQLTYRGEPLNTADMQTVFSGTGWGCWVLSEDGVLYTASHVFGQFHHSSFLEGAPVRAAGEWKVANGKIEYITGKTGHYKCDLAALMYAMNLMKDAGLDLIATKIIVWQSINDPAQALPAPTFMANDMLQKIYQSWGKTTLTPPVFANRRPRQSLLALTRTAQPGLAAPAPVAAPAAAPVVQVGRLQIQALTASDIEAYNTEAGPRAPVVQAAAAPAKRPAPAPPTKPARLAGNAIPVAAPVAANAYH